MEKTLEFYNDLASKTSLAMNTGRYFSFDINRYRKIFKDINKKIPFTKTDSVLDLGGGTGEVAQYIAPLVEKVMLVDGADKAVEFAKQKLKKCNNITYGVADINRNPLPLSGSFDKIILYGVVLYSTSHEHFKQLIKNLLLITKPGGVIFIGDMPLSEKYTKSLEERKKYPIKNWLMNQKYYFNRWMTHLFYKLKKISSTGVASLSFTKALVNDLLKDIPGIEYSFLEQDKGLPFSNSREDLIIKKVV